jgi:hypothetical protein
MPLATLCKTLSIFARSASGQCSHGNLRVTCPASEHVFECELHGHVSRGIVLVVAQIGRAFRVHVFPLRRFHEIIFVVPEVLSEQPSQESVSVVVLAVTPDRLRAGVLQPFIKAVWQVCCHIGYFDA